MVLVMMEATTATKITDSYDIRLLSIRCREYKRMFTSCSFDPLSIRLKIVKTLSRYVDLVELGDL